MCFKVLSVDCVQVYEVLKLPKDADILYVTVMYGCINQLQPLALSVNIRAKDFASQVPTIVTEICQQLDRCVTVSQCDRVRGHINGCGETVGCIMSGGTHFDNSSKYNIVTVMGSMQLILRTTVEPINVIKVKV